MFGQDLYGASPAQIDALQRLQEQAVANLIARHGLGAGDADAVLTWGRTEAQAELLLLLVAAIKAPSRTADQQLAVDWLRAVAQRQAVAAANNAGLEYVKWAGLDPSEYQRLLNRGAGKGELQAFLSGTPLNYNATDPIRADAGYCVYRSPTPYESEYTGRSHPLCSGASVNFPPPPPPPSSSSSSGGGRPSPTTRC